MDKKRACFCLIVAAFAALAGRPLSAQAGSAAVQTKFDVGGYSLYAQVAGSGGPTVIFEAGSPGTTASWRLVQPEVGKFTRTFAYDRAGLGKSDRRKGPSSCLGQVQELHALLEKAGVAGPYIYVANSYGAYLAKLFAATYPGEVAGVVFVDGTHEKFSEFLAHNLTPEQRDQFKKMTADDPDGHFDEIVSGALQVKEAGKRDALRNTPVVVLTSDLEITAKAYAGTPLSGAFSEWPGWQRDLAASSDRSRQAVIKGSGHLIQLDKPQAVIEAIREVIEAGRKSR
jgi:pimeloyl-ACP methyl ester carboxylesterase